MWTLSWARFAASLLRRKLEADAEFRGHPAAATCLVILPYIRVSNERVTSRKQASRPEQGYCCCSAVATAFSSWSRSIRITVAGDGCCPFFFPVEMTSRDAMSRRLSSWPRRWRGGVKSGAGSSAKALIGGGTGTGRPRPGRSPAPIAGGRLVSRETGAGQGSLISLPGVGARSWSYSARSGAGRVSAGPEGSAVVRSRDRYTVGRLMLNRAAISATL
jgi:hypothetical protein